MGAGIEQVVDEGYDDEHPQPGMPEHLLRADDGVRGLADEDADELLREPVDEHAGDGGALAGGVEGAAPGFIINYADIRIHVCRRLMALSRMDPMRLG